MVSFDVPRFSGMSLSFPVAMAHDVAPHVRRVELRRRASNESMCCSRMRFLRSAKRLNPSGVSVSAHP
ncbi:hypothetical protein PSAB6_10024 [Paraburkholderia sabiae]|nr:hypothetical protein PSAB6_10024 [Paraburkholderia sabiae]